MRVEIRADFRRSKGFCLFVNGEAVGKVFRTYKAAYWTRHWLLSYREVQS